MKEGDGQSKRCSCTGPTLADWWVVKMVHRLVDTKEDQANAHACGEEHRKPARSREVWATIVWPQAKVAIAREQQPKAKADKEGDRDDEEPAEVLGHKA